MNCRTVPVQATSGIASSIKLYVHPWQLHFADREVAHLQGLVASSYQTQGRQRIELDKSGGKTLIVEDKAEKRLQPGKLVHLRIKNGYIFKN